MSTNPIDVLRELGGSQSLPALPTSVARVLAALDEDSCNAREVADLLAADVGITGRVLALANSVLFNPAGVAMASLDEAIMRLGFGELRKIVVTTAVVGAFSDLDSPFDYREFWRHSLTTAIASGIISERAPGVKDEGRPGTNPYFVGGLLHDVGIMVLLRGLGKRYVRVLQEVQARPAMLQEVEIEKLSIDHTAVGAALVREWGLPESVAVACEFHHVPSEAPAALRSWAEVIYLADWIADHQGLGLHVEGMLAPLKPTVWYDLGIEFDEVPDILAEFAQAAETSSGLLTLAS